MSTWDVPEDILTRLHQLEARVKALESGPVADTKSPAAVRSATGLGTKHEGAVTPASSDGASGDIRVGNSKIWAKDGLTWKSVAIA